MILSPLQAIRGHQARIYLISPDIWQATKIWLGVPSPIALNPPISISPHRTNESSRNLSIVHSRLTANASQPAACVPLSLMFTIVYLSTFL